MIDWFIRAFGAGAEDARHALIDQGYFGDIRLPPGISANDLTPGATSPEHSNDIHGAARSDDWRDSWQLREQPTIHDPIASPDHGIDR